MENFANGRQVGVEPAQSACQLAQNFRPTYGTCQRGTHLVPTFPPTRCCSARDIARRLGSLYSCPQNPEEPSVRKIPFHAHRRVRIDQRLERIVCDRVTASFAIRSCLSAAKKESIWVLQRSVEPVRKWRIRNPGMFWPYMVWNGVKEKFHALLIAPPQPNPDSPSARRDGVNGVESTAPYP